MKATVVEGRTICPVCETDKAWTMSVDHGTLNAKGIAAAVKRATRMQNEFVVDKGHPGHLDRLEKTTRISSVVDIDRKEVNYASPY